MARQLLSFACFCFVATVGVGSETSAGDVVTQATLPTAPITCDIAAAPCAIGADVTLSAKVMDEGLTYALGADPLELSILPTAKPPVRKEQQLQVDFQLLEIDLQKMRKLGLDFASADGESDEAESWISSFGAEESSRVRTAKDRRKLAGLVSALRKNGMARVLANPVLATISGRQASFRVDGAPSLATATGKSVSTKRRVLGTHVTVLPTALGKNRAQLEFDVRISWRIESRSEVDAAASVWPTRVLASRLTLKTAYGEPTALVLSNSGKRSTAEELKGSDHDSLADVAYAVITTVQPVKRLQQASKTGDTIRR